MINNIIKIDNKSMRMDIEDERMLALIEPMDIVIASIMDAIENNNFKLYPYPKLIFQEIEDKSTGASNPVKNILPNISVTILDPIASIFKIQIYFHILEPDGTDHYCNPQWIKRFCKSKFYRYFENEYHEYVAEFDGDIKMAARLVTYYLNLFDYFSQDIIKISKWMGVGKGDDSLAKFPDNLQVPDHLHRAVDKLKQLIPTEDDYSDLYGEIFVGIETLNEEDDLYPIAFHIESFDNGELFYELCHKINNKEEIERMQAYKNYDCFRFDYCGEEIYRNVWITDLNEMLRFITDYFQFIHPNITLNETVAVITFFRYDNVDNNDNDFYMEYHIYPDGSEDPDEKLHECLEWLKQ